MPGYRKSYKVSRKPKKNLPWYKKRYNALELATKAAKGVWYLKGLVNAEKKFFDQSTVSNTVTWNGLIIPLTNVTQGDTEQNRDGNSIFLRSIDFRMIAYLRGAATSDTLRVICFIDRNAAT